MRTFPALFAGPQAAATGEVSLAVVTCHQCGRFLCALCRVEFKGQDWCPGCLEASSRKRKQVDFENHRVLYDSVALAVATFPFLMLFWPSLIGAPLALYVSIRYWKAPTSILPRTKVRFLLAIVLALGQLALMGFIIYAFIQLRRPA